MAQTDPLTVGSAYLWQVTLTKDGSPWNLAGCTVQFVLKSPSGAKTFYVAAVTNAPGGVAQYVGTGAELTAPGPWSRCWLVTDGGGRQDYTVPVGFAAVGSP